MIALKIIAVVVIAMIAGLLFVAGGTHKETPKQEDKRDAV